MKLPRLLFVLEHAAAVAGDGAAVFEYADNRGATLRVDREKSIIHGVKIIGYANTPAHLPADSSALFARNLYNFLALSLKDGALNLDWTDELIEKTCLTHAGVIKHEPSRVAVEGAASEKQS